MMPIYVRITVNGGCDVFSSRKKIFPEYWNEETGMAVKACPDKKSINACINQVSCSIANTGFSSISRFTVVPFQSKNGGNK